jgi:hypothetical protein
MELADKVGQQWNLDIVGPIHKSLSGNSYILSAMDALSSFAFFFAMPDQRAETIAEHLLNVVAILGCPTRVVSDLGSNLVGNVLTQLSELLGVQSIRMTMAYMHRGNLMERENRKLGDFLRTMLRNSETENWDKSLHLYELVSRNMSSPEKPLAPSEILFSRKLKTSFEIEVGISRNAKDWHRTHRFHKGSTKKDQQSNTVSQTDIRR